MKRTSNFLDESLERDLEILARRLGRPKAALVRDALSRYVDAETSAGPVRPRFVAIGRSGRSDTTERHEELIERVWSVRCREPTEPCDGASRLGRKSMPMLVATGILDGSANEDDAWHLRARGPAIVNFFGERPRRTVKYEVLYLRDYATALELWEGLSAFLTFYNYERHHQALGSKTPTQMHFGG